MREGKREHLLWILGLCLMPIRVYSRPFAVPLRATRSRLYSLKSQWKKPAPDVRDRNRDEQSNPAQSESETNEKMFAFDCEHSSNSS